ncbi:transposase IS66-like protein [Rhizobium sullae]|uniref:Transposase IS66-like protein n=1 Tax=Rhizobium sullae TaxID=50338 RepID=A0A4R3PTY5_RHISU|nr:transposase IS66-like protein [Rhizobium sullae]
MYFKLKTIDRTVDSIFEYWVSGARSFWVCQRSSGGGEKRENKDYLPAQELLLERLARSHMKIEKVALVSGRNQSPPYDDIASLIETCKLNAVDPLAYLTSTLSAIVDGHKQSRIEELLPCYHLS